MTFKDAIAFAADLGVEGVEIVSTQSFLDYPLSPRQLLEMRDYIESFGMEVACWSTYIDCWKTSIRQATLEDQIQQALDQLAEAKVIGAKNYRASPPLPRGHHRNIGEPAVSDEEYYEFNERVEKPWIRGILATLKKYGITLVKEIHAPVPPKVCLDLVKDINNEYVGLCPDFSVWEELEVKEPGQMKAYPIEDFKACVPYTKHVHAKAHVFNERGEEPNIPFHKLIPILKESGYTGWITAEFEGGRTTMDSKTAVKTLVELIRRYL
jgi:sugar phosphate isomerase/epimerase